MGRGQRVGSRGRVKAWRVASDPNRAFYSSGRLFRWGRQGRHDETAFDFSGETTGSEVAARCVIAKVL